MTILRIDHFVITVRSLQATVAFYERVLGLRSVQQPDKPLALMGDGFKINVHQADHTFEPKARRPTEGAADFCLISDVGVDDLQQHLQACGVAIEAGPMERDGARGRMTSVYFRDPDGNLVEVSRYADGM